MLTQDYTTNYRKNLILYWRQFYPNWVIPKGYHVHHIKPKSTFKDPDDLIMHHPSNLIALHPDDHVSIHKCRGDTLLKEGMFQRWHGDNCKKATLKKVLNNG